MPHIQLLTTADLPENADVPDILSALAEKMSSYETVASPHIKAYHSLISVWAMGEGAPAGFAHCSVLMLKGRSPELRKKVADGLYEVLKQQFHCSLEANEVSLTLEVREMDPETYRK